MNIALIDPYWGHSHRQWGEAIEKYANANVKLFSLPPRHWKWRLQGSCFELVQQFIESQFKADLFLVTSFLDWNTFHALLPVKFKKIPCIYYFHENQLCYPLQQHLKKQEIDFSYSLIQIKSALAAYRIAFNSEFHKREFLEAVDNFFKLMPDFRPSGVANKINEKSLILALGIEKTNELIPNPRSELESIPSVPTFLWNHRWEHDKNPNDFFSILFELKKRKKNFKLIVLGEQFRNAPETFKKAKEKLKNEIIHWGWVESEKEYRQWIKKADIALVTSVQENFGLSVLESAIAGLELILPNRLVYPEMYLNDAHFFENSEQALEIIPELMQSPVGKKRRENLAQHYDWQSIISAYNQCFAETSAI